MTTLSNADWDLSFWYDFFHSADLERYHEEIHPLTAQPEAILHEQLQHYIYEENSFTRQLTPELQHAFLARFYQIRRPLNVQRDYQGIAIQLWRKK